MASQSSSLALSIKEERRWLIEAGGPDTPLATFTNLPAPLFSPFPLYFVSPFALLIHSNALFHALTLGTLTPFITTLFLPSLFTFLSTSIHPLIHPSTHPFIYLN